jgi:hypothetical protein
MGNNTDATASHRSSFGLVGGRSNSIVGGANQEREVRSSEFGVRSSESGAKEGRGDTETRGRGERREIEQEVAPPQPKCLASGAEERGTHFDRLSAGGTACGELVEPGTADAKRCGVRGAIRQAHGPERSRRAGCEEQFKSVLLRALRVLLFKIVFRQFLPITAFRRRRGAAMFPRLRAGSTAESFSASTGASQGRWDRWAQAANSTVFPRLVSPSADKA